MDFKRSNFVVIKKLLDFEKESSPVAFIRDETLQCHLVRIRGYSITFLK